jgi:pyruvate,water dikinase
MVAKDSQQADRFPAASELDLPDRTEGWEEIYPSYFLFDRTEERSEYEHDRTWFMSRATTEPLWPWDVTVSAEAWQVAWAQNSSRVLPIPESLGVEIRIVAGYAYTSGLSCTDEELKAERRALFEERSEYWVQNFDRLYRHKWKPRVREIAREVRDLPVPDELPKYAPEEVVTESRGYTATLEILQSYHRLVELATEGWQRHFEFLLLSYWAYSEFYEFCKSAFPKIPDNNVVKMVSAIDVDLYRPDEELNDLARLAVDLGAPVTEVLTGEGSPEEKRAALAEVEGGDEFLGAFDEAKDPWFYMSYGNGFHSYQGSWIDDLQAPFDHLETKVEQLEAGDELDRDVAASREESKALAEEYRSYLVDEDEREAFDRAYEHCLDVYEYAEDHQFWIEHRLNTVVFRKMREFGDLLVAHDLLEDPEDVFLFTRYEVEELLQELASTWAGGPTSFTPVCWKRLADERAEIVAAEREWDPEPALGQAPESVDDPLLRMLYGITTEKVESWLAGEDSGGTITRIEGFAASTGSVEGPARVVDSIDDLDQLEPGEILVCRLTNPSWAPVFSTIAGAVTDKGGITSHAAVVCREYGIPAVTGTEVATKHVENGDRIRVDGSEGTVEMLDTEEGASGPPTGR